MGRLDQALNEEVFQLDPDLTVQVFLAEGDQVSGPGLLGSYLLVGIQNNPVTYVGFRIQLFKHQLKRFLNVFQRAMDRVVQLVDGILLGETCAINVEECQCVQGRPKALRRVSV